MSELNDIDLMNLRKRWYSEPMTLLEMVKCMNGREVAFLEGKTKLPLLTKNALEIRGIKAHSLSYLQNNFENFKFTERPCNLYTSIAKFENLPMFSYNFERRKEERAAFTQGEGFNQCFKGWDFVIDLDSQRIKDGGVITELNAFEVNEKIKDYYNIAGMYSDAKKLKKIFDEYGLAYSVKASGLKGMHFQVKDENFFPKDMEPKDKVDLADVIVTNLKELENIPTIDNINFYDSTRILKCPYSLEGYHVALPLSEGNGFGSFNDWKIEDMRLDKIYQNIRIVNRGLLERPKTRDPQEFIDFYRDF